MAGTVCNFATQLTFYLHYDDCLDIFASPAIGGIVGNVSLLPGRYFYLLSPVILTWVCMGANCVFLLFLASYGSFRSS